MLFFCKEIRRLHSFHLDKEVPSSWTVWNQTLEAIAFWDFVSSFSHLHISVHGLFWRQCWRFRPIHVQSLGFSRGFSLIPFGPAVTVFDNICLTTPLCSSIWHLVPVHVFFPPVFWGRCFHNRGGEEKTARANQSFTFPMNESQTHQMSSPASYSNSTKDFWQKPVFSKPALCPLGFWAFICHFWVFLLLDIRSASPFQSFSTMKTKQPLTNFTDNFFNQQETIQSSPKTSLVWPLLKHANLFS